jgi:hypothetical protein
MKKSAKAKRGGKRFGAGKKPMRGEPKITTGISISPTVKAFLDQCKESQSEVVEKMIRKSKAFQEWSKSM